jgi:hypothetical protein
MHKATPYLEHESSIEVKDISSEETIGAALTFLVVVGEVRDS